MNRTFQHIWNFSLGQWQVAGEQAKQKRNSSGSTKRTLAKSISTIILLANGQLVLALPTGGTIVQGSAQISESGSVMTVDQESQRTVINWNSFDIDSNETVNFNQPNQSSVALNRIFGSNTSQIFGQLNANGQIFLVNTNGVTFAPGSQVNAAAIVASTLDITDNDFMDGTLLFTNSDDNRSKIINQGSIHASTIALLGNQVSNQGYLVANTSDSGRANVAMAAGDRIVLSFGAGGLLDLEVDRGTYDALVENKSIIEANGGQILMLAQAANELSAATVNNEGIVQAQGLAEKDGKIVLLADMRSGTLENSGTLDVSSSDGSGGFIETSAAKVNISQDTKVYLSGQDENGNWLIDPNDIVISNAADADVNANTLSSTLNSGGNVRIQTTNEGSPGGNGDISVNAEISWSSDNSVLTLQAENEININANISSSGDNSGIELYSGLSFDSVTNDWSQSLGSGFDFDTFARNNKIQLADDVTITLSGADAVYLEDGVQFQVINGNNSSVGSATAESAIDELEAIGNGHYVLGDDIDGTGKNFDPIANFAGGINGLGHKIDNLTIDRNSESNIGLIGQGAASGSYFKNFSIENADIVGRTNVGTLIGATNNSFVSNVHSQGNIRSAGKNRSQVGGLAGRATSSTISDSSFAGDISAHANSLGGLVGNADGSTIDSSSYSGNITVREADNLRENIGGLTGSATGSSISNSQVDANITALNSAKYVGGIVGFSDQLNLQSVQFSGDISGGKSSGGILGQGKNLQFDDITANGSVTGRDGRQAIGGLVGYLTSNNGTPSSTFSNISLNNSVTGDYRVGGWFGIATDVVLNNVRSSQVIDGEQATGGIIGYSIRVTVNGAEYTGNIEGERRRHGGIIGRAKDTTVNNALFNGQIKNTGETGGIIGFGQNSHINNSESYGSISNTESRAGGLIGNSEDGSIQNSFSLMNVSSGNSVGGLAGLFTNSSISSSYSIGSISGDDNIGGLIGNANNSQISDSYAVGDIEASSSSAGGLIGTLTNNSSINTSYARGEVNAAGSFGLVGDSSADSSISNSFWNALDNSGGIGGSANISNSIGLSTEALLNSQSSYQGFDFSACGGAGIWCISEGNTTPGINSLYRNVGITILSNGGTSFTYNGETRSTSLSFIYSVLASDLLVEGNTVSTNSENVGSYSGLDLNYNIHSSQYNINVAGAPITLTIDPKQLTIAAVVDNKIYDGNTSAVINSLNINGLVSGDDVTANGGTAEFLNKNVGDNKTVNISSINLTGDDSGNYTVSIGNAQADITPKEISASASANDKVYDGNDSATVDFSLTGVISGDAVSATTNNNTFDNKNVAENKTVTSSGVTLSGSDSTNYVLANTTVTDTADITAKQITVTGTAADKIYDSTVNADVTAGTTDFIAGDNISLTGASGSFVDKNVADDKDVTIGGYSLSGTDAGNYEIANSTAVVQADITPFEITASSTADDKTYDGNDTANVNLAISGVFTGDTVTVSSGSDTFNNKNAGNGKTVTSSGVTLGGADGSNYVLAETTLTDTADIFKKDVTVTASVEDKIYDGTTTADFNIDSSGTIISDDDVTIAGSNANFVDKNVGDGKTVTFGDLTISGDDQDNYNITIANTDVTADITAKQITATGTAADKIYDGNTSANVELELSGVISGDTVNVSSSSDSFGDKNVGVDKTVTSTGITLSGDDGGNYVLADTTITDTADINVKDVSVNVSVADKEYDGTAIASFNIDSNGEIIVGDDVSISSGTANFDDKDVGQNKAVSFGDLNISGNDASNYNITIANTDASADINAKTITVNSTASDKIYDGSTQADVSLELDGIIAGDTVLVGASGSAFDDKNAGSNKTVTTEGLVLSGLDSGNYVLVSDSSTDSADIFAKEISVSTTASDKIYDGTTVATVDFNLTGLEEGDTVSASSTSNNFDDANAATGINVSSTDIELSGTDAGNYVLSNTDSNSTADVTPTDLTILANDDSKESGPTYSGGNGFTATGFVNGESIANLNGEASYGGSSQGAASPGNYSISISGFDSQNYDINYVDGNLEISAASNNGEGANNPVAPGGAIPPQISGPSGLGLPLGPTASGGEGDEGSVDSLLEGDLLVFGGGSKRPDETAQLHSLENLCDQDLKEVELVQCPDDSTPGK
ncbi:YDG domain-containing protein [uncultured Pseudoteredinibacter sp.]|uniref:YDG domain-containing protein n=1 Tax=uncultured Pseudoteredinibacter sp. TaxID=1641701 RepID=UPI00260929DF|nr:YDG domain-containing protein [uncultured Pseudoteredinibacter sp.]